jgi:hypothetical protein
MSIWTKLTLGCKFLFGGFESATDYLLNLLNKFLAKGHTPERIQKCREFVEMALGYMRKYADFCPGKWVPHYEKLVNAIQTLNDAFADNQISAEELGKAIEVVKDAIAEWMQD